MCGAPSLGAVASINYRYLGWRFKAPDMERPQDSHGVSDTVLATYWGPRKDFTQRASAAEGAHELDNVSDPKGASTVMVDT